MAYLFFLQKMLSVLKGVYFFTTRGGESLWSSIYFKTVHLKPKLNFKPNLKKNCGLRHNEFNEGEILTPSSESHELCPKDPDKREYFIKIKFAMDQMFSTLLTKNCIKNYISWRRACLW